MSLFGVPFAGAGAFISLIGLGQIKVPDSSVHVPLWVLAVVGQIFFLPGVFLILSGLVSMVRAAAQRRDVARHPDEPWRIDYPWDARGSRDHHASVVGTFVGAAFMTLFLVPFHAVLARESGGGLYMLVCFMLVFDLILLAVWGYAFYKLARRLKYGRARVMFERFPYSPGEPLVVTFCAPEALRGYEALRCTLRCVVERNESQQTRNGSSNSLVHREVWSARQEIPAGDVAGREVRLEFELPKDAPATTLTAAIPRYWELEVTAETPGVDYAGMFLLPVY